jgi:hypothetical protein
MKTKKYTKTMALLAICGVIFGAGLPAPAAPKAAPGQCHAHGASLTDWMVRYFQWLVGGGPNGGNGLTFLPLPAGEYVSGSFTLEDPGVLQGETEVTLKPGQSFFLPIVGWLGEVYEDTSTDAPVPDASMNLRDRGNFLIVSWRDCGYE